MKEERNKRFDEKFSSKVIPSFSTNEMIFNWQSVRDNEIKSFLTTEIHTILQEVREKIVLGHNLKPSQKASPYRLPKRRLANILRCTQGGPRPHRWDGATSDFRLPEVRRPMVGLRR